jgi:hypothetical protein
VSERPDESEADRLDRNFADLLQELRVTRAGVQILFAFLLTLPFGARFGDIDTFEKVVDIGALLSAAIAAASIIAPVAYHRMLFRRGRKPQLVAAAHRLAAIGLAFRLVAMAGAILLVTDFVLGRSWALVLRRVDALVPRAVGRAAVAGPRRTRARRCQRLKLTPEADLGRSAGIRRFPYAPALCRVHPPRTRRTSAPGCT